MTTATAPQESATATEQAPFEMRLESVRLKHILSPEETQSRTKMDDDVVQEYAADMNAGATFPPITLCKIVEGPSTMQGKYVVVDGFHRVAAATLNKAKTLNAHVFDGKLTDAVHIATGANVDHGLRRTNEDKRRSVIMAIQLDKMLQQARSDRQIADHVSVHHSTVSEIRHEIEGTQPKKKKAKGGTDQSQPPAVSETDTDYPVNNPIDDPESLEVGMLDEEGILIESAEVRDALRRRGDFDRILDDIASASREMKVLAETPTGAELKAQQIDNDLKGAAMAIKFARPYTTCAYGPGCVKTCKACKGRHWITKAIWDRLDQPVRDAAHSRSRQAHEALKNPSAPPEVPE